RGARTDVDAEDLASMEDIALVVDREAARDLDAAAPENRYFLGHDVVEAVPEGVGGPRCPDQVLGKQEPGLRVRLDALGRQRAHVVLHSAREKQRVRLIVL